MMEKLQDIDDDNLTEECLVIAEGFWENNILRGELTILKVIEHLGFLLTDASASKRELGIVVLSEILKNLPQGHCLNSQELSVISSFYADKLKDYHQVVPCTLRGILTIIEFENFPGENVAVLLNSLFHNVSCQQQQQADRHTIYRIFETLVKRFSAELLSMKLEFVYGVLQSINGERDPRNLLFLFEWLKTFLSLFSLGHLAEDFFEALACYFPVDFRAPSGKSITRDVLADALLPCLTAVPDFGEFCIPLALEKLDSSLKIAKLDSLKLLKEGCRTFEISVYIENASEISSQLQKEIFSNPTPDIRSASLETMTAIIKKISQSEDACEDLTRTIVDTLKGNLIPGSKFYQQSEDILHHVALGSATASMGVAKEIVPILLNMYVMDKKLVTLNTLVKITKAYLNYHPLFALPDIAKVPLLCLEATSLDAAVRKIGINGLTLMAENLPEEVRSDLCRYLRASIHSPVEDDELKETQLRCLKSLASLYPNEVKRLVFEGSSALDALANVAHLQEFGDFVIEEYLRSLRSEQSEAGALGALQLLLEKQQGGNLAVAFASKDLQDILVAMALREGSAHLVPSISKILKLLISSLDGALQEKILGRHLKAVYEKTVSCHGYLAVLDGLVAALRRDVQVGYEVLEVALEIALGGEDGGGRDAAAQLLANLINKRNDGKEFNQYLDKIRMVCSNLSNNSNNAAIWTMLWITKALLMRNSTQSISWLDSVLKLIDEHNEVVKGLEILMNDDYESLSSTCHCNKLLIYRQKTFVYITNRLSENYSKDKSFYSKATACLLKHTPLQAVIMQFKKISKLILMSLETDEEPENLNILLKFIKDILVDSSALIEDHLEDYLTRILRLTTFQNSMEVRIKAIQCLIHFSSLFPLFKLIPFKSTVLHRLGQCIDDKKRLVRREAVEARSLWFLLDAPI